MNRSVYPVLGEETELPFYLTGIGTTDPEYHVVRENGLVSHQIMFTTGGNGILKVNGSVYRQTAGVCVYLPPAVPHEYYPENGDWQTSWVVFRGSVLPEIMKAMGFSGVLSSRPINTERLSHIFSALFALGGDYTNAEKCSQILYELILETRRLIVRSDITGSDGDPVRMAIEYIESEFRRDISLSEIAAAAGLSEQHFCRVFRKSTGMTPIEYIAKKRISEAKTMLRDTDMQVSEIGARIGYPSRSYFTFVFRRYEGYSPTEYRKLMFAKLR